VNAFDYIFSQDEVFGFSYESTGTDFKKLNHTFVLRSCSAGEVGSIIPGISPGAQILIKALTGASSMRLKAILNKLQQNKIDLSKLSVLHYHRLNHLLETQSNTDFLVGELLEQGKKV
jgi:hypothetical protein